jgi:hypothetical protein
VLNYVQQKIVPRSRSPGQSVQGCHLCSELILDLNNDGEKSRPASYQQRPSSQEAKSEGTLILLSELNHAGYKSHTSVTDFARNFPTSFGWEDQHGGLTSGIAVALWNVCM